MDKEVLKMAGLIAFFIGIILIIWAMIAWMLEIDDPLSSYISGPLTSGFGAIAYLIGNRKTKD